MNNLEQYVATMNKGFVFGTGMADKKYVWLRKLNGYMLREYARESIIYQTKTDLYMWEESVLLAVSQSHFKFIALLPEPDI